jgi:hypothetical protein
MASDLNIRRPEDLVDHFSDKSAKRFSGGTRQKIYSGGAMLKLFIVVVVEGSMQKTSV